MRAYPIWIAIFALLTVSSSEAHGPGDISVGDFDTVPEAVEYIQETLTRQGFDILATINHGAAAASVGLDLPPTQVILFSSPRLETSLIRRRQQTAIDLPNKFLVFEDSDGEIQLEFNPAGFLVDRHDVRVRDSLVNELARTLNQFGELPNGISVVSSEQSVADTVAKLLTVLPDRGFRIPLVVDFEERAGTRHRGLRPIQLIVFGNPNAGTPLMQNDRSMGLDLPQKFLVYEDRRGDVFIAYNDPRFLATKHNLQRDVDPDLDTRLTNMANALKSLAEEGAIP